MIATLMGWGLGSRAAKLVAYIAVPLFILAVLAGGVWFLRSDAYKDGQREERAAWELKAAEMKALAEKLQRKADQLRDAAEQADHLRIAANRKEVDDAIRNIPDRSVSPRQHARACLELRRQGQNPTACQPKPAR